MENMNTMNTHTNDTRKDTRGEDERERGGGE